MTKRIYETPNMFTVDDTNIRYYMNLRTEKFFDTAESEVTVGCGPTDLQNEHPSNLITYIKFRNLNQSRICLLFKSRDVCYQVNPEEVALLFDGSGETRNLVDQLEFILKELKSRIAAEKE